MADMLSQEEINALLGGSDEDFENGSGDEDLDAMITSEQRDVLGEIGNISMGTSATTLFALLGQKVLITTPMVSVVKWNEVQNRYERPCVGIRLGYISGIQGTNVLLLKHHDVKVITSLMIGKGGVVEEGDEEINDMDLSAISEAMNQMIGSASTSLASLLNEKIDIDTPIAFVVDFATHEKLENLPFTGEYAVCVQFRMQIGDLIDSDIMQLMPMDFAETLTEKVKSFISEPDAQQAQKPRSQPTAPGKVEDNMATGSMHAQSHTQAHSGHHVPSGHGYAPPMQPVAASAAQFQNFDVADIMQQKENIEIIMDVPLEVTVELGRTAKKIREILEFSPGSIIELNKLAGEPIDILVNGKFVANGEVVVIDENFGIRVTNIINAEYRI
ncbi:MAG: flagellar motor switch phosphatase FliY [Clostridiales bacterium]|jgi:flagellar motor switch protein FliN/FliY|nr:flagellar motor switch phosphatase FliY [Clostridiales bacterium]